MPLFNDLVRRAVEANARAAALKRDSRRISELAQILRDAHAGEISIRRCAWCQRIQVGNEWLHLEAINAGQQQIAASLLDRATHGICEECYDSEMTQARRRRRKREPLRQRAQSL